MYSLTMSAVPYLTHVVVYGNHLLVPLTLARTFSELAALLPVNLRTSAALLFSLRPSSATRGSLYPDRRPRLIPFVTFCRLHYVQRPFPLLASVDPPADSWAFFVTSTFLHPSKRSGGASPEQGQGAISGAPTLATHLNLYFGGR